MEYIITVKKNEIISSATTLLDLDYHTKLSNKDRERQIYNNYLHVES